MVRNLPLLLAAAVLIFSQTLLAQELAPCATPDHTSPWFERYQDNPQAFPKTNEVLHAPVTIHIVGDDEGNGYYSVTQLLAAFCQLNEDFEQAGIQFFMLGDINYINNNTYYEHDFAQGAQLIDQYNVPGTINCYFVQRAAGACGYYSPGEDGVVLAKSCVGPGDHTWAHELGHFLSLPHTFRGWEGYQHNYSQPAPAQINGRQVEKVDGSNCSQSGDRFCDTQADYLNYRWSCSGDTLSGVVQFDPDSISFRSTGRWFMSYALDNCMSRFSGEQIAAMRANLLDARAGMADTVEPYSAAIPDTPLLVAVNPLAGSLVEGSNSIFLQWEPVPNATHYLVQWNPFATFSIIRNQAVVEGTSVLASNLEPNKTYHWRVRAFNPYQTCGSFSNRVTFQTGTLVNVSTEPTAGLPVKIYPNPVTDGLLWISWPSSATAMTLDWKISDALGRHLRQGKLAAEAAAASPSINVQGLAPGVYFLQLQQQGNVSTEKFVIR